MQRDLGALVVESDLGLVALAFDVDQLLDGEDIEVAIGELVELGPKEDVFEIDGQLAALSARGGSVLDLPRELGLEGERLWPLKGDLGGLVLGNLGWRRDRLALLEQLELNRGVVALGREF